MRIYWLKSAWALYKVQLLVDHCGLWNCVWYYNSGASWWAITPHGGSLFSDPTYRAFDLDLWTSEAFVLVMDFMQDCIQGICSLYIQAPQIQGILIHGLSYRAFVRSQIPTCRTLVLTSTCCLFMIYSHNIIPHAGHCYFVWNPDMQSICSIFRPQQINLLFFEFFA